MSLSKMSPHLRRSLLVAGLAALTLAAPRANAQAPAPAPTVSPEILQVNPETGETQEQFAARTRWWRESKFGMFIHWGVYAVPAHGEWYMYNDKVPVTTYEKYAQSFNPVKFDARKWVAAAKNAGMKYIVITSRHHDGFSMYDTKLTDYNIVKATPFHHDPMKDLARECKRQGVRLCFYHTIMDWHHPDYLPRRPWDTRPTTDASLDHYIQFLEGELTELLTHYGPIGGIWFDGGWEHNAEELHSNEVVKLIRRLQPGILINDRTNLPEDYSTPEQTIPANAFPNGRLWETCMTMNGSWGFNKDDHNWKSGSDLIRKLCDIASKGGNFLLNVGPTDQGEFPPESVDLLKQVGVWMHSNGESVYGTTKSPYKRLPFDGRCTRKGNALYLQVFQWPDAGLTLPGLQTPIRRAHVLGSNETLAVNGGFISRPHQLDPAATVVKLEFAAPPVVEDLPILTKPGADGSLICKAEDADILGNTARLETYDQISSIGYWIDKADALRWTVETPKAGVYTVEMEFACQDDAAGSTFHIEKVPAGEGGSVSGTVSATGGWTQFQTRRLSAPLKLDAGRQTLRIAVDAMPHGAVMNLRRITLIPQ